MSRIILPGPMELAYPAHNLYGLPLEFCDRSITVTDVKDFARRGLPAKFIIKRPMVRRGRRLVVGIDDLTGQERKFWLEAQRRSDLPEYRLGLYDPAFPGELVDWVGRIFGPTGPEQLRMKRVVERWYSIVRARGGIGLKLAAFPWEYNR